MERTTIVAKVTLSPLSVSVDTEDLPRFFIGSGEDIWWSCETALTYDQLVILRDKINDILVAASKA